MIDMLWPTRVIIVVVVLLIGVVLYGVFYLGGWLFFRFYRSRCPKCGKRGMKIVGGVRATILVGGKRAPDSWMDYECEKCGAIMRWHRGKWEEVPEEDAFSATNSLLR